MPIDNGNSEGSAWPLPKFRFEVDFGDELKRVPFQEVSGMDAESHVIAYRKGNTQIFTTEKMPGMAKFGNVTMKRGVFVNDNTFWDYYSQIKMNAIERRTILIRLLDEDGKVTMQLTLNNAYPTKITSTDLKSDGNEVAIDTLEITHEQLIITSETYYSFADEGLV